VRLFRQRRVGKDGRVFVLLKIRSMDDDGRITHPRLRRWGLDELPQLWNVLRGDMALFGPRPELPDVHARLIDELGQTWADRCRSRPGLLALATVCLPELRQAGRYDLTVKAEQAVLDNVMLDSGWCIRLAILRRLPRVLLAGQTC
jgi:lipopolysaccharide/colanic/teichoic acid biosynthesis glycosyltransferase